MLRLNYGRKNLTSIDFSPDGRFLAATPSFAGHGIKIFELSKPDQKPTVVKYGRHNGAQMTPWYRVNFTAGSQLVIPSSFEFDLWAGRTEIISSINVVSWPNPERVFHIQANGVGELYTYRLIDNRKKIAIPRLNDIWCWEIGEKTGKPLGIEFSDTVGSNSIKSISDDLNWFCIVSEQTVFVQHVNISVMSFSFLVETVNSLVFSSSSRYLACISSSKYVQIYHLESQEPFGSKIELNQSVSFLEFMPDDRNLLVVCGSIIYVIDTQTGAKKAFFDFRMRSILALKISDDGTMFAVSDKTGTIIVADTDF